MKALPNVTLLAISSIKLQDTILALKTCMEDFKFGAVKLVSDIDPIYDYAPSGQLQHEFCPKIYDIMDFNHYVFSELGKHVQTSHMLMVQYHAWILRPELWDDTWLEYDYIGAPWPVKENSYIANTGERVRVGNGGFSLRSKRLLDLPKKLGLPLKQEQGYYNEDGNCCCYYRKEFLDVGIKYAPIEVAARFSYENDVPENEGIESFGFHRRIK
jgi:hypothetical protein